MNSSKRALAFQKQNYLTGLTDQLTDMLNQHAEEAKAEQRKVCWHKAQYFLSQAGAWDCMQGVRDACLNATGESDD